jgi:hypothetical protein
MAKLCEYRAARFSVTSQPPGGRDRLVGGGASEQPAADVDWVISAPESNPMR